MRELYRDASAFFVGIFFMLTCVLLVLFLGDPACAQEPPGMTITEHPSGSGTLLELEVGTYGAGELAGFFEKEGRLPGATIRGKGRSLTIIHGPVIFRGAFPEMTNITVLCHGALDDFVAFDGPNGDEQRACVLFENPITATTENVTVRADVVGLRTVVHTTTENGAPDCNWKSSGRGGTFPNRHDARSRLWRDSKSEHRNLEIHTFGGGGLLLVENVNGADTSNWQRKCDANSNGAFANHVRLIGGHTWDGTSWKWHRCRLGLIDDSDCVNWPQKFAEIPSIEMHGYTLELFGHHLDVMPHLGVLAYKRNGRGKFFITGASSFIEPVVNWRRASDWHPSGDPPWVIGGDAVARPVWAEFDGGPVRAGDFKATAWPNYIFGPEKGDPLFQRTATW